MTQAALDTVITVTGGGGRHFWYRPSKPLSNSVDQVAPGIDVRTVGGYVLLPPSNHASGNHYRFLEGHSPKDKPIAAMPARLESFIAAARAKPEPVSVVHARAITTGRVDLADLAETLRFINSDLRDNWLLVGMALHHQFGGGAAGKSLWDEWSRRSTKYDERDQAKTWKCFRSNGNGNGAVTLGSVFKLAGDRGWRRKSA